MKINLGSRNNLLDGYTNIDLDDITCTKNVIFWRMNALQLDKHFAANSVKEVYSNHFFEHLTHAEITDLLYKIWVVLKSNGILKITTPDFYHLLTHYKRKHESGDFSDVDLLHVKVFDVAEEGFHKSVWYEEIGRFYLEREGLFIIEKVVKPSILEITFTARKIN